MRMQFEDFVDYVEVVASLHSWHTMLGLRSVVGFNPIMWIEVIMLCSLVEG